MKRSLWLALLVFVLAPPCPSQACVLCGSLRNKLRALRGGHEKGQAGTGCRTEEKVGVLAHDWRAFFLSVATRQGLHCLRPASAVSLK